jgi:sugar lactone lactonase YvrE
VIVEIWPAASSAADVTPTPASAAAAEQIAQLEKILDASPDNGGIYYQLAVVEAKAGRHADAIRWLERAVALGYDFDLSREAAFAPLKKFESYRELAHRLSLVAPARSSSLAFRISERDLVPEGIAWDPVTREFYVGSLAKKKIVRVSPDGSARDFVPAGRDGLWSVLGLKVDAKRRILWAASVADAREGAANGSSALFAFDLPSGTLHAKFVREGRPRRHLFNDIALADAGDVFVTDSEAGSIERLPAGGSALEEWLPVGTFDYPNGIAFDAAQRRLYVADFDRGLSIVEVATKRVRAMAHPRDVTVHAIDGLSAAGGDLVAIQNGPGMERVVRLRLDSSGERVEGLTVLESRNPEFATPTTGAVAGNDYYYLANPQLDALDDQGRLRPDVRLSDVLVFRTRLR